MCDYGTKSACLPFLILAHLKTSRNIRSNALILMISDLHGLEVKGVKTFPNKYIWSFHGFLSSMVH